MPRRISSLIPLVVVAAVVLPGCGGKAAPSAISARAAAPQVLSMIPAGTPYAFVSLEDMAQAQRPWMPSMRDLHDAIAKGDKGGTSLAERMVRKMLAELRDGPRIRSAAELGFSSSGRFAIYGLSLWPVMRFEIADGSKLRGSVERVLAEAGSKVRAETHAGLRYWVAPLADANEPAKVAAIVAVLEREIVAAILPVAQLQRAIPVVLGTEKPAQSLAGQNALRAHAQRHGLLETMLGYVDTKRVLELLAGGGTGLEHELGAVWRQELATTSFGACKADLERVAGAFPSVVLGYRRLDDKGFDGGLYFDTPREISAPLAALRTSMPTLLDSGDRPLMGMAVAMDIGKTVEWLKSVADGLRARPFTCPGFDELGKSVAEMATAVDKIPPFFTGIEGGAFVVDDVTKEPPTGTGAAIVVGAQVPTLVSMIWGMPPLSSLPPPVLGIPVEIPLDQLGLRGFASTHIALANDRVAIAIDPKSEARVRESLAARPPKHSPLVAFVADLVRAREHGLVDPDDDTAATSMEVTFMRITFDANDRGLVIGFRGNWQPPRSR